MLPNKSRSHVIVEAAELSRENERRPGLALMVYIHRSLAGGGAGRMLMCLTQQLHRGEFFHKNPSLVQ